MECAVDIDDIAMLPEVREKPFAPFFITKLTGEGTALDQL
jgi:hypothetical protein